MEKTLKVKKTLGEEIDRKSRPKVTIPGQKQHQVLKVQEKSMQETHRQEEKSDTAPKSSSKGDLKFFDPLCSPDNEMINIEAEMERRALETNKISLPEAGTTLLYS